MGYGKRYWGVFSSGLKKSTGEQVIGALLAAAIVIYQIHYGIITEAQMKGAYWSIAWPYVILVGVFMLWHLVRAPAQIDAVMAAEIEDLKSHAEILKARLKKIEDTKPCIVVRDVYTDKVAVNQNGFQVCIANVLRAKLENDPSHHYPNNEAKNVTATISFYDDSGTLLIADMDARWTASTQPVGPHWQSTVHLLGMDFGIGAKRDLDIAFAEMTYINMPPPDLVALNNDNFHFSRWKKPEHVLRGERFVAEIHVRAAWVDTKFSVEFWAMPQGEIGFNLKQP